MLKRRKGNSGNLSLLEIGSCCEHVKTSPTQAFSRADSSHLVFVHFENEVAVLSRPNTAQSPVSEVDSVVCSNVVKN